MFESQGCIFFNLGHLSSRKELVFGGHAFVVEDEAAIQQSHSLFSKEQARKSLPGQRTGCKGAFIINYLRRRLSSLFGLF